MSLSAHSFASAYQIKRYVDSKPVNPESKIAAMVQDAIESWVTRMSGNRIEYPRHRVGILGTDSDTVAILIQAGMDVLHCIDSTAGQFVWCSSEEGGSVDVITEFNPLIPYYPSVLMPPKNRKQLLEANSESLLLGNPVFHPTAYRTVDTMSFPGSVVGAFSWVAPNVNIGLMATVGAHCSLANDAIVGDFCRIDQNVSIGSGVRIGEACQIGSGAIIGNGVRIAPGTVVHPGQVVKFNIGMPA